VGPEKLSCPGKVSNDSSKPATPAMILPLPIVPGSAEDALNFIDLSGYPAFFADLHFACSSDTVFETFADANLSAADDAPPLVVHDVGDFEALTVPAMDDFHRLDAHFRLPDEVWKTMPDDGFAVFQLKFTLSDEQGETTNTVDLMAFEFPTRDDHQLFYPTVHVHDGDYHNEAGSLHTFYCQRENALAEFLYRRDRLEGVEPTPMAHINVQSDSVFEVEWFLSSRECRASDVLKIDQCQGMVDPNKCLYGMNLYGNFPNRDISLGDTA